MQSNTSLDCWGLHSRITMCLKIWSILQLHSYSCNFQFYIYMEATLKLFHLYNFSFLKVHLAKRPQTHLFKNAHFCAQLRPSNIGTPWMEFKILDFQPAQARWFWCRRSPNYTWRKWLWHPRCKKMQASGGVLSFHWELEAVLFLDFSLFPIFELEAAVGTYTCIFSVVF